jgi:hypothetical protein
MDASPRASGLPEKQCGRMKEECGMKGKLLAIHPSAFIITLRIRAGELAAIPRRRR